jgi:hypothetical protein
MDNYSRRYDNIAPAEWCEEQISRFERDSKHHEIQQNGAGATLTKINLLHSPNTEWKTAANELVNYLMEAVELYKDDMDLQPNQWPEQLGFEPPKIKRYMPNTTDSFPEHVDVGGKHDCNRFLITFVYLNTLEDGETILNPRTKAHTEMFVSKPKQGSIICFPPFWPWLHTGTAPVSGPKYIMGGYLTYA